MFGSNVLYIYPPPQENFGLLLWLHTPMINPRITAGNVEQISDSHTNRSKPWLRANCSTEGLKQEVDLSESGDLFTTDVLFSEFWPSLLSVIITAFPPCLLVRLIKCSLVLLTNPQLVATPSISVFLPTTIFQKCNKGADSRLGGYIQ